MGVLVHENCDRMRGVLLLHARRRESRMDGIEGVERARTRRAGEEQFLLLAGLENNGAFWISHVPAIVHPHLQLAGDGHARPVLQRHGEGARRTGLHLGDAKRPGVRILAGALGLLRERTDLHPHAAPLLDGRKVRGSRKRGNRHANRDKTVQISRIRLSIECFSCCHELFPLSFALRNAATADGQSVLM